MRPARALAILVLLLAGTASAAPPPGRRADAGKLVRIAREACARTREASRKIRLGPHEAQALQAALDRMDRSLAEVSATLQARELSFFRSLRSGTMALAQLGVVVERVGKHDPEIDREIRILSSSYGRLRSRYGREWLRFRTGQPIDEEERRRFERMRASQARLARRLEPLQERAEAAGDRATAGELALLIVQANRIATAQLTLEELLDAAVLSDTIQGEWDGTRSLAEGDGPEWREADQAVEDLYTDSDVGFVFTTDLDSVEAWSYVEEESPLPEEIEEIAAAETAGPGAETAEPAEADAEPVMIWAEDLGDLEGGEAAAESVEGVEEEAVSEPGAAEPAAELEVAAEGVVVLGEPSTLETPAKPTECEPASEGRECEPEILLVPAAPAPPAEPASPPRQIPIFPIFR